LRNDVYCLFFFFDRAVSARLEMREVQLGVGTKLLEKLGWSFGEGLGKKSDGVIRPVIPEANTQGKGLGFKGMTKKDKKKESGGKPPPPLEITCGDCGKVISGRKNIKEHKAEHRATEKEGGKSEREDLCLICGVVLVGKQQIKEHRKSHTEKDGKNRDGLICVFCFCSFFFNGKNNIKKEVENLWIVQFVVRLFKVM
jgi:hypothetical protein